MSGSNQRKGIVGKISKMMGTLTRDSRVHPVVSALENLNAQADSIVASILALDDNGKTNIKSKKEELGEIRKNILNLVSQLTADVDIVIKEHGSDKLKTLRGSLELISVLLIPFAEHTSNSPEIIADGLKLVDEKISDLSVSKSKAPAAVATIMAPGSKLQEDLQKRRDSTTSNDNVV